MLVYGRIGPGLVAVETLSWRAWRLGAYVELSGRRWAVAQSVNPHDMHTQRGGDPKMHVYYCFGLDETLR